jgi:hypothetical protein
MCLPIVVRVNAHHPKYTFLYEIFLASAKDFPAKDSEGFLDIDFMGCNQDLPAGKGNFSKGTFHKQ